MANVYATKNGNWSDTTVWNTGALPATVDDVYANNFTVTINQNITVLSIRTTSDTGINAGGGFVLDNAFNVTADIRAGGNANGQNCLTINFNAPNSCTLNGNIYGSLVNSLTDVSGVRNNGTGSVTVNGNIYGGGGGTSASRRIGYRNASTGNLTVNGNIYGNQSGIGASEHDGVRIYSACVVVINGNIYASTTNNIGLRADAGTYTITGKILGDQSTTNGGVGATFTGSNITINGDCEGGLASYGATITGNSVFNITGNIIGKASGNTVSGGLQVAGTSTGTITGNVTNSSVGAGGNNNGLILSTSGTVNIYGDIIRAGPNGAVLRIGAINTTNIFGNIYVTGGTSSHIVSIDINGVTLNVTGNVTAPNLGTGNSTGIFSAVSCTITVNGNVTGGNINGSQNAGVYITATSGVTVTINGSAIGGNGNFSQGVYMTGGTAFVRRAVANGYGVGSVGLVATPGVGGAQGALIYVQEFEFGARGMSPVSTDCRIQLTANSVVIFRDASLNQITLVNPSSVVTPPAVTDVRSGVTYNAGNLTGTCAVPAASSVAAGVAVDNTVGTAVLTQANVWDYALSSASSVAGSVGEKLKKTAIPADIIALG